MKSLKTIIIILLTTTIISSCTTNFLELVPTTAESSASFYKTENQINQAVVGCYSGLQSYIQNAFYLEEMHTDNTTIDFAGDAGIIGFHFMEMAFFMESDYAQLRAIWRTLYRSIGDINFTLSKLPDADTSDEVKARLEGELKFLRAYMYFIAVRYWGEIPLVIAPLTIPEAFSSGKASVNEVYDQIIKDLKDAETNLPTAYTSNGEIGRATKGAALTMLGDVYLTTHDYTNSINVLRKVQSLGVYQLVSDYKNIWGVLNENGSESIFEIQFMEGEDYNQFNSFQLIFSPRYGSLTKEYPPYVGGCYNIPTKDLIGEYEVSDHRFDASMVLESIPITYTGIDTSVIVGACIKYNSDQTEVDNHNGNNWIVYRYADVILMLAEALNEQGYNAESFDLINMIRNRAGLASITQAEVPNQEAFRSAMAHERRVEFAFENKRWFDLVRTGRAIDVITTYGEKELADLTTPESPTYPVPDNSYQIEEFELLFPIPVDEIKIYDIGQNPGYH